MNINHYINQLLYQYDCVIVPELGGFVTNYKPATIHPIQNTFRPPSKGISFNKNLNKNDGLLANFISQSEQIDYTASCKKIEEYVAQINLDLKVKKKVLIDEVGSLFLDTENRIQFNPQNSINYLLASYGLKTFQKLPITQNKIEDKITKEFKDRAAPLVAIKDSKNRRRKLLAAAITIPLLFLALWIPSRYDLSADLTYANLTPFGSSSTQSYSARTDLTSFKKMTTASLKEKLAETSSDQEFITFSFLESVSPVTIKLNNSLAAARVSTHVEKKTVHLKYHIIGGCFSEKVNAKRLVKRLKKQGFEAWIIGKRKGLWAVSYTSFATRKEALDALSLAKNDNSKAWVLNQ